jgi:hypothetical protein
MRHACLFCVVLVLNCFSEWSECALRFFSFRFLHHACCVGEFVLTNNIDEVYLHVFVDFSMYDRFGSTLFLWIVSGLHISVICRC